MPRQTGRVSTARVTPPLSLPPYIISWSYPLSRPDRATPVSCLLDRTPFISGTVQHRQQLGGGCHHHLPPPPLEKPVSLCWSCNHSRGWGMGCCPYTFSSDTPTPFSPRLVWVTDRSKLVGLRYQSCGRARSTVVRFLTCSNFFQLQYVLKRVGTGKVLKLIYYWRPYKNVRTSHHATPIPPWPPLATPTFVRRNPHPCERGRLLKGSNHWDIHLFKYINWTTPCSNICPMRKIVF